MPMLEEDKIIVLAFCLFFTNVNYLYLSMQSIFFLELHKQQEEEVRYRKQK